MADPRPGKMTLLEIVQDILSDMDSDEVNSIGDTVESLQVAGIVKSTFYDSIGGLNEPQRNNVFQLEALADSSKPNYLRLPAGVKSVEIIYYDNQDNDKATYREIRYLTPTEFVRRSLNNSNSSDALEVTDFSGITLYVLNNKDPLHYTSFDDEYLVFDAFDIAKSTTLVESRSLGLGAIMPTFLLEDDFIMPIPADAFPLVLSEAKQKAFVNLKQVSNSIEDRNARRQRVRRQNDRHRAKTDNRREGLDFGRKRR